MPRAFAILSLVLVLTIGVLGCSRSTTASPELLEKVRQQVAKTLKKDAAQLDVRKLLALQGARDIDIVVILIEVEERHKPNAICDVNDCLNSLGYEGYFVLDRRLVPVSCFDLARHQNIEHIGGWRTNWKRFGVYVNNFFFVPRGDRPRLEAAVYRVRRNLPAV